MSRSTWLLAAVFSATLAGTACGGAGSQPLVPVPTAPTAAAVETSTPPQAAETPAPISPSDPLFGCSSMPDPYGLVQCIHDHVNPTDTASVFEVTKRVAWALRNEGVGLLVKNDGENTVSWQGYSFSAGRICYPDGHVIKVITDVGAGGANGASWNENGFVDPSRYVPAIDPSKQ